MKINKVLQKGREILLDNGIDPREARFLLSYVMKTRNEELIKFTECSEKQYEQYLANVERRVNGEPYAYITGCKEFMKLNFKVNANVLIPREDTEMLVQELINRCSKFDQNNTIRILDMCTGSGCIAISLAKYIANSEVAAVDISEKALEVAKENALANKVLVEFIKSDLFEELSNKNKSKTLCNSPKELKENIESNLHDKYKFDIIVSNPPYIKKEVIKTLQKEVQKEPVIALDGGKTGLDFYERIVRDAYKYLNKNGMLAFEIGFDQGIEVTEIMKKYNYKDIEIIKDFGGNNRVVIGKI